MSCASYEVKWHGHHSLTLAWVHLTNCTSFTQCPKQASHRPTGFYWTYEKLEFISGDQSGWCVGCKCRSKGSWLMGLRKRTSPASVPAATFPGLMLSRFSKLHCCNQNGTRWRNELSLLALNQRTPDTILKPVGDSSKHFLQTLKHKNIISHKSSTIFLSTLSAKYLWSRSRKSKENSDSSII